MYQVQDIKLEVFKMLSAGYCVESSGCEFNCMHVNGRQLFFKDDYGVSRLTIQTTVVLLFLLSFIRKVNNKDRLYYLHRLASVIGNFFSGPNIHMMLIGLASQIHITM